MPRAMACKAAATTCCRRSKARPARKPRQAGWSFGGRWIEGTYGEIMTTRGIQSEIEQLTGILHSGIDWVSAIAQNLARFLILHGS